MFKRLIAVAAIACAVSVPASAGPIGYFTGGVPTSIPGLTGFATTGAMMDGLSVTACFTNNFCETRLWAGTGANSGGVTGTGWGLSVDGDTFAANIWQMSINGAGILDFLLLDGRGALTIFDRTSVPPPDDTGTPGSARGRDWDSAAGGAINVTYFDPTAIGLNAAVGDLFQQVLIQFLDQAGPRSSFVFSQDTDNDSRFGRVPEPGSLALFGIAALAFGLARRRRH